MADLMASFGATPFGWVTPICIATVLMTGVAWCLVTGLGYLLRRLDDKEDARRRELDRIVSRYEGDE